MQASGWQAILEAASNADEVVTACNEFLDFWTAAELAEIPAKFLPPEHLAADDISRYAVNLIAAVGVGNRATVPALYGMSTFFTKAALRLAEVSSSTPVGRRIPPRSSKSDSSSADG